MKDKLRELAERWRAWREGSDWSIGIRKTCAAELLEILDAEGDGGAVVDVPLNWEDAKLIARKAVYADGRGMIGTERRFLEDRVARAILSTFTERTHAHPARSGVMSAEYSIGQIRRAIARMRVANPDELEVERMLTAYANRIDKQASAEDAIFQISIRLGETREQDMDDMSWHTQLIARAQYLANAKTADVGAVREVIKNMESFAVRADDKRAILSWADKLSQAIGDKT